MRLGSSPRPEDESTGTESTESHRRALSILALCPERDRAAGHLLIDLGHFLVADGDQYRMLLASDALSLAARRANLAYTVARHDAVGGWADFTRYTVAIARALLVAPVDVVHCTTIRATYAASTALYLAALRRPWAPEPALVTALRARQVENRCALAARHLRYLCDAVMVPSRERLDALVGHGFPRERACVVRDAAGDETFEAMRAVYDEACARCARRSDPAFAYAL